MIILNMVKLKNFLKVQPNIFENINNIIQQGGNFKCIENENIKIIDIDSSKDIQIAQDILL